jgi:hypothetical protein
MAKKKSSKKAASKQGKKAAKKPAKQPARKPAAKKSGRTPKDIRTVGTGGGAGLEWVGRKAVARKGSEWHAENRIHGASAEGPFVGSTGFAVRFRMDVEQLASGSRSHFDEVGVYTIRNGKIVREEFMYGGAS